MICRLLQNHSRFSVKCLTKCDTYPITMHIVMVLNKSISNRNLVSIFAQKGFKKFFKKSLKNFEKIVDTILWL